MLHGVGSRAGAGGSVRALRLRRRDLLLARCAMQPDAPCGPTRCPRDQERQHQRGGITDALHEHLRHHAVAAARRKRQGAGQKCVRGQLDIGGREHDLRPVGATYHAHLAGHGGDDPRQVQRYLGNAADDQHAQRCARANCLLRQRIGATFAMSPGTRAKGEQQHDVDHERRHGAEIMQVRARQAGREARDPPAPRRARPAFKPPSCLRDARRRSGQLRADDAYGVDKAQHHGERGPRVHADLNGHQRDIRREQGEEAEQHAGRPTMVATNMGISQHRHSDGARHGEQAIYGDVLPEHQVQHVQRPVDQHGVHVSGTVVPDVGEAVVCDSHRVAFVEPHVAVERVGEQEGGTCNKQEDMERA